MYKYTKGNGKSKLSRAKSVIYDMKRSSNCKSGMAVLYYLKIGNH